MQITAGALVDLAQHKPEAVVDAGAICHLVRGLDNQDPKLKVNLIIKTCTQRKLYCVSVLIFVRSKLT